MTDPRDAPLPLEKLNRLAGAAEMRAMDTHAIEALGLPGRVLMENAARGVAGRVADLLDDGRAGRRVVVVCGRGNNGGDGYAAARLLANRGFEVKVIALDAPKGGDAGDNARAWSRFGKVLKWEGDAAAAQDTLAGANAIVDALFGTGLERPLTGAALALVEAVNGAAASSGAPVVGVDLPSGVHADTGQVLGRAVRCTHTVCFQAEKPGCHQHPGAAHTGRVEAIAISIPLRWPEGTPGTYRLTREFVRALLPPRPGDGHKGAFGHLLAVCGSAGMGGAALMAGLSALRIGTGLVTVAVPPVLRDGFLAAAPELMTLSSDGDPSSAGRFGAGDADFLLAAARTRSAVVYGCGVGRAEATGELARALAGGLESPLLIDADGLYALQPEDLRNRPGPTVVTPHPGELSRLSGLSRAELGADRIGQARRLAGEWGVVLVLKGAGTVVADPGGDVFINSTGDQGLATAGTGDVLSGMIGGLMAQGVAPLPSALLGVYLHGLARDCRAGEMNHRYFNATDLLPGLNSALAVLEDG